MRILAIETSCDETAIAIADFEGSKKNPRVNILSHIISSQAKLHAKFGGVVPNLAKREHQRNLVPILLSALNETRLRIPNSQFLIPKQILKSKIQTVEKILDREPELLRQFKRHIVPLPIPPINAIAVTYGPGLAPALWVGVNFAKALAYLWNKPLIPVNHMAGHAYSALLQKTDDMWQMVRHITFPALALLVSGGHTELVLMRDHGKYKILGETLDDAAGEAFDKVARILGFPYPGGPKIEKIAERGDPKKYKLPSPMLNTKDYNFSFSGLKTAVLYLVRDRRITKADVAAAFEKAVVDVLVKKTVRAAKEYGVKTILLGGGVAANEVLRRVLTQTIRKTLPNSKFRVPTSSLCGDNALMIAIAAHYQWASLAPKGRAAYLIGKKKTWTKVQANPNVRLGDNQ